MGTKEMKCKHSVVTTGRIEKFSKTNSRHNFLQVSPYEHSSIISFILLPPYARRVEKDHKE